jgi:ComF family protein
MMADTYLKYNMQGEIIVPVPMSEKDVKKRGFNQAELLAYEVGKRLDIPVLPALVKVKETSAQKELSGRERAENLEKAFEVIYPQIKDRKILLIDDIFTTGATANECAKTLLKAKCKEVSVLTACITKLKPLME